MTDHTPERIHHIGDGKLASENLHVADIHDMPGGYSQRVAIANRMAAAYNACAGIPTELLINAQSEYDDDLTIKRRLELRRALAPFRKD